MDRTIDLCLQEVEAIKTYVNVVIEIVVTNSVKYERELFPGQLLASRVIETLLRKHGGTDRLNKC
jgi:hypothetical protein